MANNILAHPTLLDNTQTQKLEFVIREDGIHRIPEYEPDSRYAIIINGDEVAWSPTDEQAWRSYHEMLAIDSAHYQREAAHLVGDDNGDWVACQDCGRVIDDDFCPDCTIPWDGRPMANEPITEVDEYGLEATF